MTSSLGIAVLVGIAAIAALVGIGGTVWWLRRRSVSQPAPIEVTEARRLELRSLAGADYSQRVAQMRKRVDVLETKKK